MSIAVHYMQLHVPLRDVNNFLIFPKMAEIEDNTLLRGDTNFSSNIEKYFTSERTREEKFRISSWLYDVLFFYKHQWNTKPFHPSKLFSLRKAGFIV